MAEGPLLPAEEFTIRQPLFQAGVWAFFLGTLGGLIADGTSGKVFAAVLDVLTMGVLGFVLVAVRFWRWGRPRAVATILYAGALNFVLVLVQIMIQRTGDVDVAIYNNLFILALFLGISTFLVGGISSLIFGGTMLIVLLGASFVWNDPRVTSNLWFETPAVIGACFLLYHYRSALDRLLADLQRIIRENASLRDRERLAALGELSAGIAHEIKNPLNLVVNFAESSQDLLGELEELSAKTDLTPAERDDRAYLLGELRHNLEAIRAQGLRGASTVQAMLLQVRTGTPEAQAVDLNEVVSECLNLAWAGNRVPGGAVRMEPWPQPAVIQGSRQDLARAFLNLCTNAVWSVAERGRREGSEYHPEVVAKVEMTRHEARVMISDNGVGFSASLKAQLFVPFFTTKPAGQGTGLGLALTKDVVDGHGGRIEVDAEPNRGARFTVVLPRNRRLP